MKATNEFVVYQTVLRIKEPEKSLPFYEKVLGMTLLDQFDFPDMTFRSYFLGYPLSEIPEGQKKAQCGFFSNRFYLNKRIAKVPSQTLNSAITIAMGNPRGLVTSAFQYPSLSSF